MKYFFCVLGLITLLSPTWSNDRTIPPGPPVAAEKWGEERNEMYGKVVHSTGDLMHELQDIELWRVNLYKPEHVGAVALDFRLEWREPGKKPLLLNSTGSAPFSSGQLVVALVPTSNGSLANSERIKTYFRLYSDDPRVGGTYSTIFVDNPFEGIGEFEGFTPHHGMVAADGTSTLVTFTENKNQLVLVLAAKQIPK